MESKPKRIKLVLDSGVTVLVAPLSPYTRQALLAKLYDKHPNPNPADYNESVDGSDSPGSMLGGDNPQNTRHAEYREALEAAQTQRNEGYVAALCDICLTYPEYKDTKALENEFKPVLKRLQGYMDIDDSWESIVRHCIIGNQHDINEILEAAHGTLDVIESDPSDEEIFDAWRIFQCAISREKRFRMDKLASSVNALKAARD